jgi:galactose mutarotase-like enzyme
VGIWSKPEGADFVCIEPWYGIADSVESKGELEDKKGIIKLAVGEKFKCSFSIVIE